jgi:hypothetical protein
MYLQFGKRIFDLTVALLGLINIASSTNGTDSYIYPAHIG